MEVEVVRRGERGGGGQGHGPLLPAELPGDERGEKDEGGAPERGKQPDGEQRIAEDGPDELEDEDRKRRMVDVAEGEMVAAGDVVELVPEPAEPVDRGQGQAEIQRGQDSGRKHFRSQEFLHLKTPPPPRVPGPLMASCAPGSLLQEPADELVGPVEDHHPLAEDEEIVDLVGEDDELVIDVPGPEELDEARSAG